MLRHCDVNDSTPVVREHLRDRDGIYGHAFGEQIAKFGIEQLLSAPRSPRQRVIGTIRRECLDHVLVLGSDSLHRHLRAIIAYYHQTRTHLALTKDAPLPRPAQKPVDGRVVAIPEVGGLHHRYELRAA